ncbi:Ger(x)C family spore germination protein [Cytobacillus oceanisediminis]|uniref:Ger(x)C family spore germination protein n=1 Tax=Cytobacillus oceanisediminis TaxID=665099 RepID=UPI001FB43450|nr:Ger(x)C family spore germination protein [Cytobacillus oceanisediminis]UOE53499.1 Ger(x)C family spore germination protein [Cytobacillus oceanisediminis]
MVNRTALWMFVILLLSGCSLLPTNIVNEVGMIQAVGYDFADEGGIIGSVAIPIFKKDKSSTEVKSAFGHSSKEIRTKLTTETHFRLVSGQLRIALYGKDLAERGINDIIDTLNRDPFIGSIVQLAIVDGEAKDVLNLNKDKNDNISIYLQEMLDQNMEFGQLPKTNLQTFLFQLFQIGQDPYLPIIKNVNGSIRITGMAFFKYDKYITSIPMEDVYIFKTLLKKNRSNGQQTFMLENGDKVVLETLYSNPEYKVKIVHGRPEFTINLKMSTKLQEFSSSKKQRQSFDKKKYQKEVEQEVEKKAVTLLTQFKEQLVDPLGLGAKYKEHFRAFDEKQWDMYYPEVKVSVKANVEIQQTGTID